MLSRNSPENVRMIGRSKILLVEKGEGLPKTDSTPGGLTFSDAEHKAIRGWGTPEDRALSVEIFVKS